jgi:hypothetical protein
VFKPSSIVEIFDKKITVKEISFGEYKGFLKVLFRTSDSMFFEQSIINFLSNCTDLLSSELSELNCIELLVLLIEVRILSIGSVLRVHVEDEGKKKKKDEKDKFKEENPNTQDESTNKDKDKNNNKEQEETKQITTISKSLYNLKADLLQYNNNNTITFGKLKVMFTVPKLSQLSKECPVDYFIRCLEINDSKVFLNKIKKAASDFLPAVVSEQIKNALERYFNFFSKLVFVTTYEEDAQKDINMSLEYDFFVHIVKLLFGDDLLTLHQNCFKLSQFAHIDLNYINNIPPGDVFLYMKILDAEIKAQNQLEQNNA